MSEKQRFFYEKECYRDEWYGPVGTYIDKEKGQYIEVPHNTVKPLVDTIMEQKAIIEEQEKVIKKQRKEYINLKENMDALRRTWAKRYKNKKRRVWNY